MNLTAGILTIGSLYWDNDVREKWRQSRLKVGAAFSVTVPICYGRKAGGRGDTYTMVFSPGFKELGQAKAIPCSNLISSASDLVHEAELLWAAERKLPQPDGRLSANWGCVALLPNPERDVPKQLLDDWAHRISRERNYGQLSHTPIARDRGLLQIPWPEMVDAHGLLPLDLLLATANEPTLDNPPNYPSPEVIALAWKQASEKYPSQKYDNYFWNNKKNGITTFQDDTIEQILAKLGIRPPQ
jgi:hypothetical protein